jgi:hypothetical protein
MIAYGKNGHSTNKSDIPMFVQWCSAVVKNVVLYKCQTENLCIDRPFAISPSE